MTSTLPSYHVAYYALLREERGLGEEEVRSAALTPADLYEELRRIHGFSLPRERMGVAVNDRLGGWDTSLSEGDRVVFLPPVAGG